MTLRLCSCKYRRLQARRAFQRGTQVGHLQSMWLREGQQQPTGTSATTKGAQAATKAEDPITISGHTICKMYNTKTGFG